MHVKGLMACIDRRGPKHRALVENSRNGSSSTFARVGELEEKGTIDIAVGDVEDPITLIPLEDFVANQNHVARRPGCTRLRVYCGSGHRSTMALAML